MEDTDVWKVKLKFYDKLFDSYRKEIDCLWQRSIFLGTFLVLAFTGYGFLVKEMLCSKCFLWRMDFHILGLIISFLGVVFSVLWILMAKGSKAWQEVYEKKIGIFEDALGIREMICDSDVESFETKYGMKPELLSNIKIETNNAIFSMKAGGFSVGKINICIGQIFYVFWSLAFCLHFTCVWLGDLSFSLNLVLPVVVSLCVISAITAFIKHINRGSLSWN